MTATIQTLPKKIIQALEQEKLSTNQIIYYDSNRGWICQQRDNTFMNLISNSTQQNPHINHADECRPLEKLGPFGIKPTEISLTILENTDMYQIPQDQTLSKLKFADGYGQHAPIVPVTLTERARDVAYIPHEATHFCWIYPLAGLTQLSKKEKAKIDQKVANGDLEYTLLALGGFVYFRFGRHGYRMLQANCLVQADNGLTFQGPYQWRSAYTDNLAKQGRFQNVTISSLSEMGIKHYCFLNPNEKLTSSEKNSPDWIPASNGGFVYLYNSPQEPHIHDRYFCVSDKPLSEQISTQVMPFSFIIKREQSKSSSTERNLSATSSLPTSDINNNFMCSICLQRTVRCIFIPCKHMCTCNECAHDIRQKLNSVCPICRQKFNEIWNVFL